MRIRSLHVVDLLKSSLVVDDPSVDVTVKIVVIKDYDFVIALWSCCAAE